MIQQRFSELEDGVIKIIQSEQLKEQRKQKMNRASGTSGTVAKVCSHVMSPEYQREETKYNDKKNIRGNNGCNFSNLSRNINEQI